MKSKYTFLFCFFIITSLTKSQTSQNYAVMLTAAVSISPASITLKWTADTLAKGYIIYKKDKAAIDWGAPIATLPKTALQATSAKLASAAAWWSIIFLVKIMPSALVWSWLGRAEPSATPITRTAALAMATPSRFR